MDNEHGNQMETTIWGLGFRVGIMQGKNMENQMVTTPLLSRTENQIENNIKHEMASGVR